MGAFSALLLYARFFAAEDELSKARLYKSLRTNVPSFAYLNDYLDIIMGVGA